MIAKFVRSEKRLREVGASIGTKSLVSAFFAFFTFLRLIIDCEREYNVELKINVIKTDDEE